MTDLPHSLTRSILIHAPREVVFRYFTDSERFARWWGKGSTIEPRVGGAVKIVYPNQIVVLGEVTTIEADRAITFTYGYESTQPELPPGSTLVTIELDDDPAGTRLQLRHDLPTEKARSEHDQGWRFQLALFANAVANENFAAVADTLDQWFEAWAETDPGRRRKLLEACTTEAVTMRDNYSNLSGRDQLEQHIVMCHIHMPGAKSRRTGEPKQCQGTAIVDWAATGADGNPQGQGTNVVQLAADGRIASVTGFW